MNGLAERDDGDIRALCDTARAIPLAGNKPATWTPPWATSSATPTGCATPTSRNWDVRQLRCGRGRVQSDRRQRLKMSGMRWTLAGATGILTLRCLQASDRWEQILIQPGQTPAA
jgi:hypothetical protein